MLQDAQDEALLQTFIEAQLQREQFLSQPPRRKQFVPAADVDLNKGMLDMLVGGMVADNIRRGQQLAEVKREAVAPGEPPKKVSLADKIAEGVRRDIEKLEKQDEPGPRHQDQGS
jgi:hypothetical protein